MNSPTEKPLILALDQGTSSSRSILFDASGQVHAMAQREFRQIYPHPGWVEHDPLDIWNTQLSCTREVLQAAGDRPIVSLGITNQRETTLLWRRATGEPLHNAIVWQDRRTEHLCADLQAQGLGSLFQSKTGLRLDPYFSGTKLKWLLDTLPGARAAAQRGELAFGTVDTWLMWQLSAGRIHATDVTNASRTLLFNQHTLQWDDALLELLDIPREVLPVVLPSSHVYGYTDSTVLGQVLPISGVAGDQQSALFGQACFQAGMAKITYGTGCFMLMHTGALCLRSQNGLLSTCAAQSDSTPGFALEGSVFIGGAVVQWLRDGLHAIGSSSEVQALAESVPDAGGVVFVPALVGLGAPYWEPSARGAILGLTRGSTTAHIARAALESIAFQSAAVMQAINRDAVAQGSVALTELRVDGGASVNDLLMQFQADLLGIPVVRPRIAETTALGAAHLAGLSVGLYRDTKTLSNLWQAGRRFTPQMERSQAVELMAKWERAVRQTIAP